MLAVDYMIDAIEDDTQQMSESQEAVSASAFSPAAALRRCIDVFSIDGLDEFPNAAWPEFFAALACQYLGAISFHLKNRPPSTLHSEESAYYSETAYVDDFVPDIHIAGFAARAMEAICCGEFLRDSKAEIDKLATAKEKGKQKLNAQKGGIAKHAEAGLVKDDFVAYVRENDTSRKSISKLSQDYCKTERYRKINTRKKSGEEILQIGYAPVTLQKHARIKGLSRRRKKNAEK